MGMDRCTILTFKGCSAGGAPKMAQRTFATHLKLSSLILHHTQQYSDIRKAHGFLILDMCSACLSAHHAKIEQCAKCPDF